MIIGTDSTTQLNDAAATLARNRDARGWRVFSIGGRALVELHYIRASELWDVGAYSAGIGSPRLTQDEGAPWLLAAYGGRLARRSYARDTQVRRWLASSFKHRPAAVTPEGARPSDGDPVDPAAFEPAPEVAR